MAKRKEKTSYEQLREKIKDGSFMQELEEKQEALGLLDVMAYCCNRCHYLWFPKDYDLGENILELEPPKACARCKSRYWNKEPVRKTQNVYSDKYGMHHYWNTMPRLRALHRKGKLDFKVSNWECQYCKAISKTNG